MFFSIFYNLHANLPYTSDSGGDDVCSLGNSEKRFFVIFPITIDAYACMIFYLKWHFRSEILRFRIWCDKIRWSPQFNYSRVRRIVGKFFSKKPQLYAKFPTIRVRLGKCALIGQLQQYLEFIHVIELKRGQSKNFWWF